MRAVWSGPEQSIQWHYCHVERSCSENTRCRGLLRNHTTHAAQCFSCRVSTKGSENFKPPFWEGRDVVLSVRCLFPPAPISSQRIPADPTPPPRAAARQPPSGQDPIRSGDVGLPGPDGSRRVFLHRWDGWGVRARRILSAGRLLVAIACVHGVLWGRQAARLDLQHAGVFLTSASSPLWLPFQSHIIILKLFILCLGIVDIGSSIMQSILILISRYIYKNSVLIHACFALQAQEGVSDTPLCSSATRKPFWRLTKCPAISPPSFSTAPRKTALVNSVFANCSFGLEHWKWAHTYPSSFADSGSFWLRSPGEVVIQPSNHGTTWGLMSNTFVLSILRLRKRPINKADLLSDQENLFHRFSLNFKLDVQAIMDENVKYPITYEYDLV